MKLGPLQKKILIVLAGTASLSLAYTPRQRARTFSAINREWAKINQESLRQAINSLYKNKMIDLQEGADGKIKITLLDKGKKKILEYKLDDIQLEAPKRWDGKWRMILFDIPNPKGKARNAFRSHLKRLGFYQYQKSAFVHPFPCEEEINFLIEFYQLRPYVRLLEVSYLDNERHLKEIFKNLI